MVRHAHLRALADLQDLRPRRPQTPLRRRHRQRRTRALGGELGVPHIPHRSGGGLTADETHAALRRLLREHHPNRFPTLASLKRHGPRGLAAAVSRTGGTAHWADVLNMPAPPPARWTDELIEAELRRICRNATRWPSRAEFEAAGATGLLLAIYAGHGSHWWAQRLGLSTEGLRARRREDRATPAPP